MASGVAMVTVKVPSMSSTPLKAIFFFSTRLEEVDDVHWKLHWPGSRAPTKKTVETPSSSFLMDASLFCRQIKCYALIILSPHTHIHTKWPSSRPQESVMGIFPLKNKEKTPRKWWITKSAAAEYKNYQFNRPTEKCSPKTRWKIGTLKLCLDKYIPSHGPPGSLSLLQIFREKIK